MTVPVDVAKVRLTYAGDTAPMALTGGGGALYFLSPAHLVATHVTASGARVPLIYGEDFSISGDGTQGAASLVPIAARSPGVITVRRQTPNIQQAEWSNGDGNPSARFETTSDYGRLVDQEISERVGRALTRADTDPVIDMTLVTDGQAGKVLALNADADGFTFQDPMVERSEDAAARAELAQLVAMEAAASAAPSPFLPQFGVVGDGVHDDTAAWQSWFDFCSAGNLPISCPLHVKSKITDTLTILPGGVTIDDDLVTDNFDLSNVVYYWDPPVRDRPCLEIGDDDGMFECEMRLPEVRSAGDLAWDATAGPTGAILSNDVAIRIHRPWRVRFHEGYVNGFTKGIEYIGNAYCIIFGRHIIDCRYGRLFNTDGGDEDASFANENVILGGRIGCSSRANGLGDAFGQVFTWDHVGSYRGHNSNKFVGPCFEMAAGTGSYRVPILFDGVGANNDISKARHESGQGPFAICIGGGSGPTRACNNHFHVLFNATGVSTQYNLVLQVNNACGNIYRGAGATEIPWHSGDLGKCLTTDGNAAGAYINHRELFCYKGEVAAKTIGASDAIAHRSAMLFDVAGSGQVGVAIDTRCIKNFRCTTAVVPGFTGRARFYAFDAAGNRLTGAATDAAWGNENYVKGSVGIGTDSGPALTASGNAYAMGSDGPQNCSLTVTVREEVAVLYVLYQGGTKMCALRSLAITGYATVNTLAAAYPDLGGLSGLHVFCPVDDDGSLPLANSKPSANGVIGFYPRGRIIGSTVSASSATPGWSTSSGGFLAKAWAVSTAYPVPGMLTSHDTGKIYELVTAGTSASSGGPTGTGTAITDGTCVWNYIGTAATFCTLAVSTT